MVPNLVGERRTSVSGRNRRGNRIMLHRRRAARTEQHHLQDRPLDYLEDLSLDVTVSRTRAPVSYTHLRAHET